MLAVWWSRLPDSGNLLLTLILYLSVKSSRVFVEYSCLSRADRASSAEFAFVKCKRLRCDFRSETREQARTWHRYQIITHALAIHRYFMRLASSTIVAIIVSLIISHIRNRSITSRTRDGLFLPELEEFVGNLGMVFARDAWQEIIIVWNSRLRFRQPALLPLFPPPLVGGCDVIGVPGDNLYALLIPIRPLRHLLKRGNGKVICGRIFLHFTRTKLRSAAAPRESRIPDKCLLIYPGNGKLP